MFYSKTTNGFYSKEIHGDRMPKDCVEISDTEHAMLLQGQSEGKIIAPNGNGFPVLQDPPEPTNDELKAACKARAKQLLVATDWSQQPDVAAVLTNKAEFDAYRAAVRDLFLRPVPNPIWPDEPQAVWSV